MKSPLFGNKIDIQQIRAFLVIGDVLQNSIGTKLLPLADELIRLISSTSLQIYQVTSSGVLKVEGNISTATIHASQIDVIAAINQISKEANLEESVMVAVTDDAKVVQAIGDRKILKIAIAKSGRSNGSLFEICKKNSVPLTFTPLGVAGIFDKSFFLEESIFEKYWQRNHKVEIDQANRLTELAWLLAGLDCSMSEFGMDPDRAVTSPLMEDLKSLSNNGAAVIDMIWRRNLWTFCDTCAIEIGRRTALVHSASKALERLDYFNHEHARRKSGSSKRFGNSALSLDTSLFSLISTMISEALSFWCESSEISLVQLQKNCAPLCQDFDDLENRLFFKSADWSSKDSVSEILRFSLTRAHPDVHASLDRSDFPL